MEQHKVCRVCGKTLPVEAMKRTNHGKPDSICRACFAERQREWYAYNQQRVALQRRLRAWKKKLEAGHPKAKEKMEELWEKLNSLSHTAG